MSLSSELISQFVKITNDKPKEKKETTVYGEVVEYNGKNYVRLDGSDLLTPMSTTVDANPGERVAVLIKNHTATVTGNISSPSARTDDVKDIVLDKDEMLNKIEEFEIAIGNKLDVADIEAIHARIDDLTVETVNVKDRLQADEGDIDNLQVNVVTIQSELNATKASIDELEASILKVEVADAKYATIESLDATNADIHNLETTYGDIHVLIFGSATGNTIQTSFANSIIAQLGEAQIKSAMIENIAADKISSGDIITNNVRVMSEDGGLIISDETLQINDGDRVRVQIGKDSNNDYSINIWDTEGNLMFSEGGITDSAIKDAIIRNDMVSDTANISAHKLNIDSLFEEINGSSKTINSTKIFLDDKSQTLDVAFKSLSTEVDDLGSTVTSQGTQITVLQGQITNKVWQQDINEATNTLGTQYSTLEQTVNGFVTTVTETYATLDDLSSTQSSAEITEARVSTTESLIQQLSQSISMLVTDNNGESLMTQTENGWTFSTSQIQEAVDSTAESLNNLTNEVGDINSTVGILEQAVNDIGVLTDYVKIKTYDNEPCIELGETDSDFKLLITNTRIMFMEGTGVPAYINNQSLFIKKAVIQEELQQGEFVWKARANGNLGLIWKGAAS